MPDGANRPLPGWPRALREEWAAAYVGLSPTTFRQVVAPAVPSVRLTAGRVAWLREALDAWLEERAAPAESVDAAAGDADAPANPQAPAHAPRDPIAAALARLGPAKGRARRQGAPG